MFSGKLTKFHNLVYPEVSDLDDERLVYHFLVSYASSLLSTKLLLTRW